MGFFVSMECDSIEDYSRGGVSSDFSDFSDFSVSSEERKTGRREDSIFWCRRPKRLWDLLPPTGKYTAMILGFWMHYLPRSVGGNRLQQLKIGARRDPLLKHYMRHRTRGSSRIADISPICYLLPTLPT